MAIILLALQILMFNYNFAFSYGVDFFITSSLFYSIFFPLGLNINIRNLLGSKLGIEKVRILPMRVLQIHLSMVYFISGLEKALGINWWNGESMWKAVHMPIGQEIHALLYQG